MIPHDTGLLLKHKWRGVGGPPSSTWSGETKDSNWLLKPNKKEEDANKNLHFLLGRVLLAESESSPPDWRVTQKLKIHQPSADASRRLTDTEENYIDVVNEISSSSACRP